MLITVLLSMADCREHVLSLCFLIGDSHYYWLISIQSEVLPTDVSTQKLILHCSLWAQGWLFRVELNSMRYSTLPDLSLSLSKGGIINVDMINRNRLPSCFSSVLCMQAHSGKKESHFSWHVNVCYLDIFTDPSGFPSQVLGLIC